MLFLLFLVNQTLPSGPMVMLLSPRSLESVLSNLWPSAEPGNKILIWRKAPLFLSGAFRSFDGRV